MNTAILCDFDDTITEENVAHLILERFGDGSWRETRQLYLEGAIPAKDYFEKPFLQLRATRGEMQAQVREAGRLRHGFVELADYCKLRGIELAVVTVGLDFYVQALLEQHQLDWLPVYAVETRFTDGGIQFAFPYAQNECGRWGICKCSVVERYQAQGKQVIYIGDGRNDLCPASRADAVFARDVLVELCRQEIIPHQEFQDFTDVISELERR